MPPPRQSEMLAAKIRLASPCLERTCARFWSHPRLADLFPGYLRALYHSMRVTVPLLEMAASRCRELGPADSAASVFAAYCEEHAAEEMHHDEWLLEDVTSIGISPDEMRASLPPVEIAAMAGAQMFWIRQTHPVALLGYLAVLEGMPPLSEEIESIRRRLAFPAAAFRTLMEHADMDRDHAEALNRTIDRVPADPKHSILMAQSAFHTVECLYHLFDRFLSAPALATTA